MIIVVFEIRDSNCDIPTFSGNFDSIILNYVGYILNCKAKIELLG